jgi:predicted acylesterase/phospholipase RssA
MRRELPLLHKKTGTALVLSGGATKALYFHIGVLKALDLTDITSIVGTSAGAVAGALVASGVKVEALLASLYDKEVYVPHRDTVVKRLTSTMVFKPSYHNMFVQSVHTTLTGIRFLLSLPFLWRKHDIVSELVDRLFLSQRHVPSFFNANELENLFKLVLPSSKFADTKIDLYIVATSLDRHERAVFNAIYDFVDDYNHFMSDVPIHRAVRASLSLPGMFEPVKIKSQYYVDGEIRQTLSMDIGLALADRIVLSHTYHPLYLPSSKSVRDMGWLNIVKQALHIALYERIAAWRDIYREQYPDKEVIWIEPDLEDEEFFLAPEFSFRAEVQKKIIQSGEEAARKALSQAKYSI